MITPKWGIRPRRCATSLFPWETQSCARSVLSDHLDESPIRDTDQRLNEAGWVSLRIWEHEDPYEAALRVRELVTCRLRDR